jgi:hypothetical protein
MAPRLYINFLLDNCEYPIYLRLVIRYFRQQISVPRTSRNIRKEFSVSGRTGSTEFYKKNLPLSNAAPRSPEVSSRGDNEERPMSSPIAFTLPRMKEPNSILSVARSIFISHTTIRRLFNRIRIPAPVLIRAAWRAQAALRL